MSTQSPPADKRLVRLRSYSVRNMIYSMLAVLAVGFAWWALIPGGQGLERQPIDITPVAGYAADQAEYDVWVPGELPAGWSTTSARYEPVAGVLTWHVGLQTPGQGFASLEQAASVTPAWRDKVLPGLTEAGDTEVKGPDGVSSWQVWEGRDLRALLLPGSADGRTATMVVRGTVPLAELEGLIATLQTVRR